MPLLDEKFAKTYTLEAGIYSYTWTLANYQRLADYKDMGEFVDSPKFVLHNQSCFIQYYPKGRGEPNCVSAYVRFEKIKEKTREQSSEPVPVKATAYFSIITNLGKKQNETIRTISILDTEHNWQIHHFMQQTKLTAPNSDFLIDDSIKLRLELKVFYKETHVQWNSTISSSSETNVLINNMGKLFLKTELSDVKFKFVNANGKELPAHKIILALRLPFFQKMFQCNMKENTANIVEITDIEFNVFKEMLRFLYTGKVKDISAVASNLIVAADKYGIDNLKNKCAEHLYKTMTLENVLNILEIANTYNVEYLKHQVLLFVKEHFNELMRLHSYETWAAVIKYSLNF